MRIRRGSYKKYLPAILVLSTIIFSIIISIFIINKNKSFYKNEISKADELLEYNKRFVFMAASDLKEGEIITEENTYLKEVIISEPKSGDTNINQSGSNGSDIWINEDYMNQMLLVDVPKGMFITKNMLVDFEKENEGYREVYVSEIKIFFNIQSFDYCDIRIIYPNGETYIVLSKKKILNISDGREDCCLWLNPEEIHLLQSAIVDCNIYEGSRLILTKYINSKNEKSSAVNYIPSLQTLSLIYKEGGINKLTGTNYSKEERESLEERLSLLRMQ